MYKIYRKDTALIFFCICTLNILSVSDCTVVEDENAQ